MDLTTWLLLGLLLVAVTLVALAKIGEADRRLDELANPRPVRIRLATHSEGDRPYLETHRMVPPPPLRHGGVVGRRRAVILGEDEEWISDIYDR